MLNMWRWRIVTRAIVLSVMLAVPVAGYAQEAAVSGTVTDSTGGVLPGVAITAVHEATGNTFEAVTDERGAYRIPVRIGVYRVTAVLPGFSTFSRTGLEVLVGQTAVVNLQLAPSTLQETVTVTAEAPLINTTSSTLGHAVDPRRMQELPLNGRQWMDLALLVPGSRENASGGVPQLRQGYSQINVDGQAMVNMIGGTNTDQPKYSRDAIAEFEVITNRFDATEGRSAGMIVNAITKSGTNTPSGSFSGYFRDDRFNAADFIQKRVLPYSNQDVSWTYGGPIQKDKIHVFGNYEYEREPQTITFNSPFPSFNVDLNDIRREHKAGVRLDAQFSPQTRLGVRSQRYHQVNISGPGATQGGGGATSHPSTWEQVTRDTTQLWVMLTQVLSNRAMNEVRGGFAFWLPRNDPLPRWKGGPFPNVLPSFNGQPQGILFRGYTVGSSSSPKANGENAYSIRDDFTLSFTKGGRHDVKLGGDYVYNLTNMNWCSYCSGTIDARGGPIPANIESILPVWNDASTWNLAALSPITVQYQQSVSNTHFHWLVPQHFYSGWAQDNWTVTRRLTLNLGVRYELQMGMNSEKVRFLPWLPGDLPHDKNDLAPRLGFAFSLNDRTVVRGGYGKFFARVSTDEAQQTGLYTVSAIAETYNDGRPDFAASPFNGPGPTYDQVLANACDLAPRPGCVRRSLIFEINNPWRRTSYSHQASIGVQRQLGATTSFEANYVYTGGRLEEDNYNINLSYNPATGVNYPFSDISKRPFPDWGIVNMGFLEGWSNYHGLETAFTKRLSHRWQASATYTYAGLWDGTPPPPLVELVDGNLTRRDLGFPLASDLIVGKYSLAVTDQRHRAVLNGIWDVGYGLQLSGLYFYGSGSRFGTSYGGDPRDTGLNSSGNTNAICGCLRPNGTIVPRNTFVGKPIHRVDLRIQRHFQLARHAAIDGILEGFNLFDHANYGSYVTVESNRMYGQPSYNSNVAYQPRMLQLGFRLAF